MTTDRGRIFVGMGSNLGDSLTRLRDAWEQIGKLAGVSCISLSSPYVTAPVDMHSLHWFTNAVGELRSQLKPHELLNQLLAVEAALGRTRDRKDFGYQDRVIDLDILYIGETVMDTPELILPHPHLYDRLFVLTPLAEIAPDFVDCKSGRPIQELELRLRERIAKGAARHQEISRTEWMPQAEMH